MPRKPALSRPPEPDPGDLAPGPGYPALEFARQFDMLTDEEIEAWERGNAEIVGNRLILPGGVRYWLYPGRRLDMLADRLLGLDQEQD